MKPATAWCVIALVGAALGGCKSPSTSFYALSPDASLASTGSTRPVVAVVGPVTIPETVDRPQIVTRVGDAEVAVNEFARWAQPLGSDIGRVIAADLSVLLDSPQISVYDMTRDPLNVWHVRIDVMRFESVPGRDVTVDVQWAVRAPGKVRSLTTGRSVVHEPVSESGFAPLVAAHDRALASVSRDIAAAIQAMPVQ